MASSVRYEERVALAWVAEDGETRGARRATLETLDAVLEVIEDFTLRFGVGVYPAPTVCAAFCAVGGYLPAALMTAPDLLDAVFAMEDGLMRRLIVGRPRARPPLAPWLDD